MKKIIEAAKIANAQRFHSVSLPKGLSNTNICDSGNKIKWRNKKQRLSIGKSSIKESNQ